MIKFLVVLLVVGFQLFAETAQAGQSAELVCAKNNITDQKVCEAYELRVKVTSDSDAGQFGAFGIFADLSTKYHRAYWRVSDGWSPYTQENILQPVDGFLKELPASRNYVVYRGALDGLCKLSGGDSFNLYAGHGTLTPERINRTQLFLHKFSIEENHARNFWNMTLLKDALDGKKGGLVFSHKCT